MKKIKKDHPEVTTIKSICNIAPDTKRTKEVCEKVNKDKLEKSKKNHHQPVKVNKSDS